MSSEQLLLFIIKSIQLYTFAFYESLFRTEMVKNSPPNKTHL